MAYVLLVVEPAGQRAQTSEQEGRERYEQMLRFSEELQQRQELVLARSLRDTTSATRVSLGQQGTQLLDGPFAEAKEMIGGFFLLQCENRERALEIARACPAARWATIEVRELGPCFL